MVMAAFSFRFYLRDLEKSLLKLFFDKIPIEHVAGIEERIKIEIPDFLDFFLQF